MKKLALLFPLLLPAVAYCQWGVSYHQSALSFIGVNYEIKDRYRPELRVGTDLFFEDWSLELVGTYDILDRPEYELYAGLGLNGGILDDFGVVVPVGLNVYPFDARRFGFHMEFSPMVGPDDGIIRGSLGIRYNFRE